MKEYIEEAEKALLHTYNRFQIVLDRGEGVHLYDIEGREYLDFVSGIAVFALGYNYKDYNDALKAQIDKLLHTSNYYYNIPAIEAAKKLKAISGMDRVFFTNSGAEAVEGAIKAARKYAYSKDGQTDHEIIAMEHSFHGRTMGALSVTGNPKYQEAFRPMIGNVRFAKMNDLDSVKALEKEIFNRYEGDMRNFTLSQGKMLIRLISRECNQSSYALIRAYRGSFVAGFWQGFARLFGANLKDEFGESEKDAIVERVILLVEAGQL